MTEFAEVVRSRRMTRAFDERPIDAGVLDELVELAARAPSAGKTQGWHLVVLEGDETALFWDATLPARWVRRQSHRRWPWFLWHCSHPTTRWWTKAGLPLPSFGDVIP